TLPRDGDVPISRERLTDTLGLAGGQAQFSDSRLGDLPVGRSEAETSLGRLGEVVQQKRTPSSIALVVRRRDARRGGRRFAVPCGRVGDGGVRRFVHRFTSQRCRWERYGTRRMALTIGRDWEEYTRQ